jgi:type I restriction enzyme S subunit
MSVWRECLLGDVVNLKRGYDLPHSVRAAGPFPVVSSSGITDHHAEAKVKAPGVVTGRYGTLGQVFFIEKDYWPLNTSLYVQDFKGNDPRFISYFLGTLSFGSQNAAGAVPGVNRNHLHAIKVRVPPLPIQRRIAGILSAYDELIENSQRRIKILESMARALYREWFVHFRFPGHESVPRVPSPLGEIPKGWECATFAQAAVFENGDRGKNYPNGSDFVAEGIPFINAGHLVDGAVNLADMNYIAEEKFGQLRSGKIRMGDLLFCLRGSPGRTARTTGLRRGAIASSLVIIRPTERSNEAFLFYTLVGEIGKQMAIELDNGAAQPNVSVGSVQKYPLLLPPMKRLNNFEISIDPIWRQMEILRDQLSNLRRQRDLLLPRLLSGQIDVEAIES